MSSPDSDDFYIIHLTSGLCKFIDELMAERVMDFTLWHPQSVLCIFEFVSVLFVQSLCFMNFTYYRVSRKMYTHFEQLLILMG